MKIPLKKAIGIIIAISILISGSAAALLIYYKHVREQRIHDSKYNILAIVSASTEKEPLQTVYLAELLNLSVDKSTNLYNFSTRLAERKLLASPLIKKAEVKKIYPGTLYVRYDSSVPIAFLVDFENTAIDKDEVIIPFKPFFTPKILPEIYLGLDQEEEPFVLGMRLKNRRMLLSLKLLDFLNSHIISDSSQLKRIDVSHAFDLSFGQKEIIVMMQDLTEKTKNGRQIGCSNLRILRLSSYGFEQELFHYLTLRKYLIQKEQLEESNGSKIVDLRIPNLAFVSQVKN